MNVALGQRLDSEVANDSPQQKRVDEADDIAQNSDAEIDDAERNGAPCPRRER